MTDNARAVPPRPDNDPGPPLAFATDADLFAELGRRYLNVLLIALHQDSKMPTLAAHPNTNLAVTGGNAAETLIVRHAGDTTRTLGMFVRVSAMIQPVLFCGQTVSDREPDPGN